METKDLSYYKTAINLAQFMIDFYGFKEAARSSENYPRLKNPETGELYIIKKNSKGHYTYFNPYDYSDRGKTIIDFLQDKHSTDKFTFTIGHVRKKLDYFLKNGYLEKQVKSKYNNIKLKSSNDFNLDDFNIKPLFDTSYLNDRGISNETIKHPIFKGCIFNNTHIDEKTGIKHINTVYLMVNADKERIPAIIQKNKNFSGAFGEKGQALVASKLLNKNPIDNLIVMESFDDCLSHFELNKSKLENKNIRYVATGGSITDKQIDLISEIITKQQVKNLSLSFDNDNAGYFFRCQTLARLTFEDANYYKKNPLAHAHIEVSKIDGNDKLGIAQFIYVTKDKETSIATAQNFADFFNKHQQLDKYVEGKSFFLKHKEIGDFHVKIQVEFKNLKEHWEDLGNFIEDLRFSNKLAFQRDVPILKDFNEDLQAQKFIHKDWFIYKNEIYQNDVKSYLNAVKLSGLYSQKDIEKGILKFQSLNEEHKNVRFLKDIFPLKNEIGQVKNEKNLEL
jgi:hypothetical protein